MNTIQSILQNATPIALAVLGAAMVVEWLRYLDRGRGYLALAVVGLALVFGINQANTMTGYRYTFLLTLDVLSLLISGYAVMLFRDTLIPLSQRARRLLLAAMVMALVLGVVALPTNTPSLALTPAQLAAVLLIVGVWAICVVEPTLRLAL